MVNPIISHNYSKTILGSNKNDYNDAFALADFAASNKTNKLEPFKPNQHFAIQSLARQRKHYIELLAREKVRILNYIFIKFSDFNNAKHQNKIFSNTFGKTAIQTILEFKTPEEIVNMPLENLVEFIKSKSKNCFEDCTEVANTLKKACNDSYRLDKLSYDSVNTNLAIAFSVIDTYKKVIKQLDEEIEKLIRGSSLSKDIDILCSIPGISNVFAASILSELGDVANFKSDDAIAKYSGIYWNQHNSGDFISEDNRLKKVGNAFLRYYLIEATSSVISNNVVFKSFYDKKLNEVSKHKNSRALVLSSRKFIRLIYKLLKDKKLYEYPLV